MDYSAEVEHYNKHGWVHIPSVFVDECTDEVKRLGLPLRENWRQFSSWKGISCASRFNKKLFKYYTNKRMYHLAHTFIGENVHIFNDQMVIKLPYDDVIFEPHYDNQYGPKKNKGNHTLNICWILDDFTPENGTLEVQSQDTEEWVTLYPKKGDVVLLNGNTYHRSSQNRSDEPRGLYACVFAEKPIYQYGFYTATFTEKLTFHD